MSSPVLGKDAVIQIDSEDVGYAKNVRLGAEAGIIKDYVIGDSDPAVLEYGNYTYTVRIEKMWIDKTYMEKVLNGTKVSIVVRPEGTGSGKTEITLSNVVLNRFELNIAQDGVVMESIEGEGKGVTISTQS